MKVRIYAADTLVKFTNQILIEGFRELSVDAEQATIESRLDNSADAVIFQLHGAPQAEKDDKKIMELIQESLQDPNDKRKKIVMIHRPDEIQKYTELKEILSVGGFGFVNFGENHINDDFYPKNVEKMIIPHGFSSKVRNYPNKEGPIVIGSHTSWGEMRSLKQALVLIGEVFKQYDGDKKIFGYLGGKPLDLLQIKKLKDRYGAIINKYSIYLKDIKDFDKSSCKGTVFVSQNKEHTPTIPLSFNIQMYYLGNQIRTGEASGTIYRSISVPVILEMNGTRENLKVIKVPYSQVMDINSVNLVQGAKKIVESIKNESYRDMISHNLKQAEVWDEKHITSKYLKLINRL